MSSGISVDLEETKAQQRNPSPSKKGRNWLRHGDTTQCAFIDAMLLEGTYSLEQMAEKLNERFEEQPVETRIARIHWHFDHLQDRWIGKMAPHELKLKEMNGKWKFDV